MQDNSKIEFLEALLKAQGVVVASVSDGHVLTFTHHFLKTLVEKTDGQNTVAIFIKNRETVETN